MDVEAAEARQLEHGGRQDEPVGHDNEQIRLPLPQRSSSLRRGERRRLAEWQMLCQRRLLDGARHDESSTPSRAVGLSEDADERVARACDGVQGGHREFGRTGECDAQGCQAARALRSLRSLSSFLRMRSRFNSER